jgi:CheY-like chemotaxis protein
MTGNFVIFIVEDNKTESMMLRLAFAGLPNVVVHNFPDGRSLIENLDKNPDIIMLDLNLPDIYGLNLIDKVRESNKSVEFIVVSAQEEIEQVAMAQNKGVYNYIVKSESCLIYIKKVLEDLITLLEVKKS